MGANYEIDGIFASFCYRALKLMNILGIFALICHTRYDEVQIDKGEIVKKLKKPPKIIKKSTTQLEKKTDKSLEIFGVQILGTRKYQVLSKMWLQRKEMLHIATVNPEYIMEVRHNPRFREVLSSCLTVADGYGVVWASQILQSQMKNSQIGNMERISGVELVEEILRHANEHGEKVFLLGASHGVAEKAAAAMARKYPNVRLSWYEGAKTVKVEQKEEANMTIAKINGFEPDYLLVAYGSPWQDIWIEENRPYLRARVAMGVGGTLDEWAGTVRVNPAWVDSIGMKWLWRVINEPWRWRRILRVLQFGFLVLLMRLKKSF